MTAPASEYLSVAGRPWDQRRPGVHWKVLRESGDRKTVIDGGSDARYLSTGHLVYAVGGVLYAARFDLGTLEPLEAVRFVATNS